EERVSRGAGASGEVAAVVHDDLGAGPATARAPERLAGSRAGLLVVTSAAVVLAAGLVALSALRPTRVTSARSEIAHIVTARRLALLRSTLEAPPAPPQAAS